MGVDCSFYVKTIETHALAFFTIYILAIGRVGHLDPQTCPIVEYHLNRLNKGADSSWTVDLPLDQPKKGSRVLLE